MKTSGNLPGRFFSIIGTVSKSNQLHVVIFWFFFIKIEVYSMDSSKVMGHIPEPLNLNRLFLKL